MHIFVTVGSALATIAPIVIQQIDERLDFTPSYVIELKINRVEDGVSESIATPRLVVPAGQRGEVVVEADDDLLVEIRLKTGRNVEGTQHRAKFTLARPDGDRRTLLAEPELLVQTGQKGQVVIASDAGESFSCEILVQKSENRLLR